MANFARIINNVAVDVSNNPTESFHPDIAEEFVSVPDNVKPGWVKVAGVWKAPAVVPTEPAAVVPPKIGPIAFQMLFTVEESAALAALRETDKALGVFWKLIDDPRTDEVDLSLSSVQAAIGYSLKQAKAAGVNLDVAKRKSDILTGILR